jgi:deoxycytidine triphosphate deaminase
VIGAALPCGTNAWTSVRKGERTVAALITDHPLKELIQAGQVVFGGKPDSVEGIKYDFRLGNKFLKASLERPVDFNELTGTDRAKAKIEPGEVVFVMTEERLCLPMDMFVMLAPKRKISHDGIAVMGGVVR